MMFGKKKNPGKEEENDKKPKKPKKPRKPKKEKKKKEPKPKRQKKEKAPKPKKQKKPKPPKQPKASKGNKEKKKLNPLLLVLILVAVVVIAAGVALVILNKKKEEREDAMYGPMFFFAEEDGIESIRSKIGDREIKGGYTPPEDVAAEETPEDATGEDTEEGSGDVVSGDSLDEEDPELANVDIQLLTDQHLTYVTPEDGAQEAETYIEYLVQEKNFTVLTYPAGSEGEIPSEPAQEESEDSEEESQEFTAPEEGYYIVAADNSDTAEEGADTEIKRIRMEYSRDSYTLRLSTASGKVDDLVPKQEEKEGASKGITLSEAVQAIQGLADVQLGLPKPTASYDMTPIEGRVFLNGVEFYNIRAYERGTGNTVLYAGTFYVACENGAVYKYDEMTKETTLISGEDILAQKGISENVAVSGNS